LNVEEFSETTSGSLKLIGFKLPVLAFWTFPVFVLHGFVFNR
jgi:hypothetical protein